MDNLTVKMRIKTMYRDMNPKEKQIADYILENLKLVSRGTINGPVRILPFTNLRKSWAMTDSRILRCIFSRRSLIPRFQFMKKYQRTTRQI